MASLQGMLWVAWALAAALGLLGALGARWAFTRAGRWHLVPAALAVAGAALGVAWGWAHPHDAPPGQPAPAVLAVSCLLALVALGLLSTVALAERFGRAGWADALGAVVRLAPSSAALAFALSMAAWLWGPPATVAVGLVVLAILFSLTVNAGFLAAALSDRGGARLARCLGLLMPTAVATLFTGLLALWLLRETGLLEHLTLQLWAAMPGELGLPRLLAHWAVVYLGAVAAMATGAASGLWLGPARRAIADLAPGFRASAAEAGVLDLPRRPRWVLPTLALLWTIAIWYASLIPFQYRQLGWDQAVARFQQAPYLDIDEYRRADWMANLVLFVPGGLLWAGAVDGSRRRWLTWLRLVLAGLFLAAVIVGIEFTQVWFPIRTVSRNDMYAEAIGSVAGMVLWLGAGRWGLRWWGRGMGEAGSPRVLRAGLWVYLVLLVGASLLPLDPVLSLQAFKVKVQLGRVAWLPWSTLGGDSAGPVVHVLRQFALFVPVGVLAALRLRERSGGLLRATGACTALAVFIELGHLVTFTNVFDPGDIVLRSAGGYVGAWLTPRLTNADGALAIGTTLRQGTRAVLGWWLCAGWSVLAVALLWRPWRFVLDPGRFARQVRTLHYPPFVMYYWVGEWAALTKLVSLALLLAPLGAALRWRWRGSARDGLGGLLRLLGWVLVLGLGVEVGQAFITRSRVFILDYETGRSSLTTGQALDVTDVTLSKGQVFEQGPMSDITDLMAYLVGAAAGWWAAGLLLPRGAVDRPRQLRTVAQARTPPAGA